MSASNRPTVVAAAAPDYGVGWVNIPADGETRDLSIQLWDDMGQVSLGAAPGMGQTRDVGDVLIKREGE